MWKRWTAWVLWMLGAGLLWLFENGPATLTLLAASLLLPLASILSAAYRGKRARLSVETRDGELELRIDGLGFLSCAACEVLCENRLTDERIKTGLRLARPLSGEARRTLKIDAAHCGTLRVNAAARVQDLFGLWKSPPLRCGEEYITLQPRLFLPAVVLTESAAANADNEQYSQQRPGSDPSETFAVREYIPGDPIRQIHWKLSQKTDTLMMRELGLPVVSQTLLIFRNLRMEGESVSPDTADALAEIFLSVSHALVRDGLAHTAAFAENGRFTLLSVQNEVDLHAMEAQFLTIGWEVENGVLLRLLTETPSAHVIIVSAAVPPDAEHLPMGGRVTLLTPAGDEAPRGVHTVPFQTETYENDLSILEL